MVGFALVMFWVFAGIFGGGFGLIMTHEVLEQSAAMKNELPGTPYTKMMGEAAADAYPYYLLGGDNLGRDVFSRMVVGAWEVIKIAPFASVFAFMVGITLGLPAGITAGGSTRCCRLPPISSSPFR